MNLKNLTKEQKQYMALGGIVALVLVAGVVFGIKLSLSSIEDAKLELSELEGKIESADLALSKQGRVRAEFAETMGSLKEYLRDAPPNQNYYSWATEAIYATARKTVLEIDAIDEQTQMPNKPAGDDDKPLTLEPYSLRIAVHGGYEDLKGFLELMEKDHPLARVVSVDISTGSGPEIHDMQLVVQWPFNLSTVADAWAGIAVQQEMVENSEPAEAGQAVTSTKKMPVPPPPRPTSSGSSKE